MSSTTSPSNKRGAKVAVDLGWPPDRVGFLGALGGLVDLGAPHVRPRRSVLLAARRHDATMRQIKVNLRRMQDEAGPFVA